MDLDICYIYMLLVITLKTSTINCEKEEVCRSEEFNGRCPQGHIMVTDHAIFGRMRLGRCVKNDLGHLGCENDVLPLVTRWCSGRQECTIDVNDDIQPHNTECMEDLLLYLDIEYHCLKVMSPASCPRGAPIKLHETDAYISSHVTDQTGCGTSSTPWVIQAKPGQNVELWLQDFGAPSGQSSTLHSTCMETFGFIIERNLGINVTICGGQSGNKRLYKSKSNILEIHLLKRNIQQDTQSFLLQYKVIGCPELVPPAHAWYRKDATEAVIGCDSDDREWRLHCNGATWEGFVGNCTEEKVRHTFKENQEQLPFSTIILLTGVVCAAILLIIIVMVAGTIYIKKQSINHDMKLRSEYGVATLAHHPSYTLNKNPGYDTNTMKSNMPQNPNCEDSQPLVHVLDRTLSAPGGTPTVGSAGTIRLGCACNTLPRPLYTNNREDIHGDLLQ